MCPVRQELGSSVLEDGILQSHRRENLKSYVALTDWALQRGRNVFPVRYELGFYVLYEGILPSHRRENLESHINNRLFEEVYLLGYNGVKSD
jgi:hypothetical protein